jgi:hypothetical protein
MAPARVLPTALVALLATCVVVAEEPRRPANNSQLIVLTDGRVLEGTVTRQATGYFLERSGGRMVVPFEQVRCVARDLFDAYRQQREAMVDPTASDLVKLAEWCLSYRLYGEARVELNRALRRDPENETARRMLARLEDTLLTRSQPPPTAPLLVSDGLVVPEVEALGGLSRPVAAQFTSRVQPLLMNKCGNASCHGSAAKNDFRLTPVRLEGHGHRRGTEQNLALVLHYVNIAEPQQSELLNKLRGTHGGAQLAVFTGAQGAEQQKLLRDWVSAMAKERRDEDARLAQRPKLGKKPAVTTAAVEDPAESAGIEPTQPHAIIPAMAVDVEPAKSSNNAGPDAFDPEEFNRKFGAKPGIPRSRR